MSGSRCGSTTQLGSVDLNKMDQVDVSGIAADKTSIFYIILLSGAGVRLRKVKIIN